VVTKTKEAQPFWEGAWISKSPSTLSEPPLAHNNQKVVEREALIFHLELMKRVIELQFHESL
jgi:hypothetical protein